MRDVLFLALLVAFFGASTLLVRGCLAIVGEKEATGR